MACFGLFAAQPRKPTYPVEGAYFAAVLAEARKQGRVGRVAADPLLPIRLFWDIGGAGAKADACAIWVCQWVHQEIKVLDYIEGQGQVLGYYTNELLIGAMERRSASCCMMV